MPGRLTTEFFTTELGATELRRERSAVELKHNRTQKLSSFALSNSKSTEFVTIELGATEF